MHSRIETNRQGLAECFAINAQHDRVLAGDDERSGLQVPRKFAGNGVIGKRVLDVIQNVAVIAVTQSLHRRIAKIPDEAI